MSHDDEIIQFGDKLPINFQHPRLNSQSKYDGRGGKTVRNFRVSLQIVHDFGKKSMEENMHIKPDMR